jgi:hypothetical protein
MIDTVDADVAFIVASGQAYGNFKVRTGSGTTLDIAMGPRTRRRPRSPTSPASTASCS